MLEDKQDIEGESNDMGFDEDPLDTGRRRYDVFVDNNLHLKDVE